VEYNPIIEVNMTKRINKHYPEEFKQEAVALVFEQNYTVVEAAASLGVTDKILYNGLRNTRSRL
jgi:transposase